MGLDISAYRMLTKLDTPNDESSGVRLMDNTDFPGRAAPFTDGRYDYSDGQHVLSLSYGSYNRWREWLAKLAGYPAMGENVTPHSHGAFSATEGPFWELINFADNEGTIGTVACQKLLKDFNQFEQKAQAEGSGWEFDHYVDLHEGLRLAADGGCLKFS